MENADDQRLIDTHCHILPGVDDGSPDEATSLEMCSIAAADGIGTILATPHIVEGVYDGGDLKERVCSLQGLIDKAEIAIRLLPGAELPVSLCAAGDRVVLGGFRLAGSDYLLVEMAEAGMDQLKRAVYQVRLAGFYPVLAHPERTPFVMEDPDSLLDLVATGQAVCQLTASSLNGPFGRTVRRTAEMLLKAGVCHLISSDAHSTGRRSPRLSAVWQTVAEIAGGEAATIICKENPQRLIDSEMLKNPFHEGIRKSGRGFWQKMRRRKGR